MIVAVRESIENVLSYISHARALFLRLERCIDDVASLGFVLDCFCRLGTYIHTHTSTSLIHDRGERSVQMEEQRLMQLNATAERLEHISRNIMDEVRLFDALKACRPWRACAPLSYRCRPLSCAACSSSMPPMRCKHTSSS